VFSTRGTLVGEDSGDRRRAVPWRVWMRRLEYRWVVDSLAIESTIIVR
jgi:hypothetical protein